MPSDISLPAGGIPATTTHLPNLNMGLFLSNVTFLGCIRTIDYSRTMLPRKRVPLLNSNNMGSRPNRRPSKALITILLVVHTN